MKHYIATVSLSGSMRPDGRRDVQIGTALQVSESSDIVVFVDTLPIHETKWNGTIKLTEKVG